MTFTPSSDATLTFGCSQGSSPTSSASGDLWEGSSLLLFHSVSNGPTGSIQIYAGHTYQLVLSASVYSMDGATAYAELSALVPAPGGAVALGLGGLLASRRRR